MTSAPDPIEIATRAGDAPHVARFTYRRSFEEHSLYSLSIDGVPAGFEFTGLGVWSPSGRRFAAVSASVAEWECSRWLTHGLHIVDTATRAESGEFAGVRWSCVEAPRDTAGPRSEYSARTLDLADYAIDALRFEDERTLSVTTGRLVWSVAVDIPSLR